MSFGAPRSISIGCSVHGNKDLLPVTCTDTTPVNYVRVICMSDICVKERSYEVHIEVEVIIITIRENHLGHAGKWHIHVISTIIRLIISRS